MNAIRRSPGARGIPQPFNRQPGHASQFKPMAAQLKNGVSAQSVKSPVAPPVYRPQATPNAAQPKMGNGVLNRKSPVAPPVYRPQQVPKVLQTMRLPGQNSLAGQAPPQPIAPTVYRPKGKPIGAQAKMAASSPVKNHPVAPPVYCPQQTKALQPKMAVGKQSVAGGVNPTPKAPPVYKPQPTPKILQRKEAASRRPTAGGVERKPAVAGVAQGSALKPLAPGRFAGNLQDVVQLVMAYRVERASVKGGGYRTEIDKKSIKSLGAEATISISFGSDAHSDHFLGEHATEKARLVTWEMDDKFWDMLKYKKGFGKQADKEAGRKLVEAWAPKAKSSPSGSDGASLDTLTKKTALTFADDWYPVILSHQVKGTAHEQFFEKEEAPVKEAVNWELIDDADGSVVETGSKSAMEALKADFGNAGFTVRAVT